MAISDREILDAVNTADEWMTEHRVTESWRMISRLRNTIVRMQDQKETP